MHTQNNDLSNLPKEQSAHDGYEEIHRVWKTLWEMVETGKYPDETGLNELVSKAQYAMTGRERRFMDGLHSSLAGDDVRLRHAKLTSGLNKVLWDRHGFKVSKEGGGLG